MFQGPSLRLQSLSIDKLSFAGLHVVRVVQEQGEMIVTWPKAYHCGFSHGWNCSEAINFAPFDWLPKGFEAVSKYCKVGPAFNDAALKVSWQHLVSSGWWNSTSQHHLTPCCIRGLQNWGGGGGGGDMQGMEIVSPIRDG